MKNLLYIISLCGLLTACDLQEEPYGFYSDDNFYKSETDAESGLLYAYNALTFLEYSRGIFYIGDIPTETMSPSFSTRLPGMPWMMTSLTEMQVLAGKPP